MKSSSPRPRFPGLQLSAQDRRFLADQTRDGRAIQVVHDEMNRPCPAVPARDPLQRGDDVAFRALAAGNHPDFRMIADVRKTHLIALRGFFEQVLRLAREPGAPRVGRVALDGSKIRANASKHKAMSYGRMREKQRQLREEVKDLLAQTEPEPSPEFELPLHGPAVLTRTVTYEFPCDSLLSDDDGGLWDLTAQLYLYDPSGNEVFPRPASHYVFNKPSITSNHYWTLTDPAEGQYKCKADYWISSTHIGFNQGFRTLSCLMPTGESTSSGGWYLVYQKFYGGLYGGNFNGRKVREQEGPYGFDHCYFPGSTRPPFDKVSGGTWDVSNNGYGEDLIGYGSVSVAYYRNAGVTGGNGCHTEFDQDMQINTGTQWSGMYKRNRVKAGIGNTWIWSERDGVQNATPW